MNQGISSRNRVHEHKTMKFDVVGERPVTNYIPTSGEQTKKSRNFASPQNTAHGF